MSSWLFARVADSGRPGSLSARLRRRRFDAFRRLLGVGSGDRILDVGGNAGTWTGSGLEPQVTLLNVMPPAPGETLPFVVADACAMDMFAPGAFDVVYSNSVIEHVGAPDRQARAAAEIARVGRRYWVQTPWKHFPVEAHMLFPFFQYLPAPARRWLGPRWPYSHFRRNGQDVQEELGRLRLLGMGEMRRLFPGARLFVERFGGLPKSVAAYRAGAAPPDNG